MTQTSRDAAVEHRLLGDAMNDVWTDPAYQAPEARQVHDLGQGIPAATFKRNGMQRDAKLTDLPGFRSIATRAQSQGVSITTIGVDVDYDEKALSAVALASNGRHYYVENDAGLARVFEAEAAAEPVEATPED